MSFETRFGKFLPRFILQLKLLVTLQVLDKNTVRSDRNVTNLRLLAERLDVGSVEPVS